MRSRAVAAALVLTGAGVLAGCGSSTPHAAPAPTTVPGNPASGIAPAGNASGTAAPENAPPGDIPDTVAYVAWTSPDARIRFVHPEGWAMTAVSGGVTFTDKLNRVTVTSAAGPTPTVDQVRTQVVPTLGGPGRATQVVGVESATLPAGPTVRVTWRVNSEPDPVTGKVYRDEVVTYLVGSKGQVVRMDLSGAVGSDNVDPYRKMSQSLVLS